MLSGAARRHHARRRPPGHVEDGAFADQGQDEGDEGAGRGRDVGTHVLYGGVLRPRRRAVRRCAVAAHRRRQWQDRARAALGRPRLCVDAGAAHRGPRGEEVRDRETRGRALQVAARRQRHRRRACPVRRRLGPHPGVQHAAGSRGAVRGADRAAARGNPGRDGRMVAEPGREGVAVAGRRWLLIVIGGVALTLLVGRVIAQIYTDYLWYASLGTPEIWRAKIASLVILRLACGIVATLFVFANLYAVRQSVVSLVLPRRIGNLDIGEEVPRRQLTWTAAALSTLIGIALAWSQRDWSSFLAARVGVPFGESDPYFVADLGFFVYRLPLELSLFTWAMTTVLIIIGLVVLLYALTPSLRWEQGGFYVSGYVRRHLAMLAGVLLLVLSWHYRLEMYTVLGSGSAPDGAFTSLDHRVGIPASLLLSLVTLGAGLTVLWAGWTGQLRLAFAALTGVIVAALAARQLAPFIARRAVAERDPIVRE